MKGLTFVVGPGLLISKDSMPSGELKAPEVAPRDSDSQFGKKREYLKCVKTIPKVLLKNTITIY